MADAVGRRTDRLTLPALYAALVRDEVGDFPALRPHQRHVWHAFLVQVAALALHRERRSELPDEVEEWRRLLLKLTPDDSDGAAWALVTPHDRPALLQAPVPGASLVEFKKVVETPDALDMLVTAKNHDVKRTIIVRARPEHWVYALVSLQTQEGFLGAGNYGISRMNGGFANRPGIGIESTRGLGARVRRDVWNLIALRERLLEDYTQYPRSGGHGLIWLLPWNGRTSLDMAKLDVFYVEICRRVRLTAGEGGILRAQTSGSSVPRIDANGHNGRTGDPWTPLIPDKQGPKALTLDTEGFSYKRLVPVLFPKSGDANSPLRAPLQEITPADDETGLSILARAIVRGQGKTGGYHERRVPISRVVRSLMAARATDEVAEIASQRVEDAGLFAKKVLFPAALAVFTAAPSKRERKRDDHTAKKRASRTLHAFDGDVDATFFHDLEREVEQLDEAREAVRAEWLVQLLGLARVVLTRTLGAAPTAAMRSYRTRVRARRVMEAGFRRLFGHRMPDAKR
jgi:CRISPR system Cascade subunit CasA